MNDAPILSDDDPYSMPSMPTMRGGDPAALGRIDHYDILRKLGGGGFGVVYLAKDTASDVEVAIKTLHPLLKHNADEMDLLREKFRLVSRLSHPNIATALVLHPCRDINIRDDAARAELKLSPGDNVMVMRYAPGVTLSKWRRQFPDGVVPPDLALEIGRQVAAALDYAHGERIVHRDIKPGNIMVETLEDGGIRARILDFGLAAEIRSSMSRVSTEQGDTSGTRPYMAPEQWLGKKQDGRTDQYALACVLYELLSGAPPFAGVFETGDPAIMRTAVTTDDPEEIDRLKKNANTALQRALAKNPIERFPTCEEFVSTLFGMTIRLRGSALSRGDGDDGVSNIKKRFLPACWNKIRRFWTFLRFRISHSWWLTWVTMFLISLPTFLLQFLDCERSRWVGKNWFGDDRYEDYIKSRPAPCILGCVLYALALFLLALSLIRARPDIRKKKTFSFLAAFAMFPHWLVLRLLACTMFFIDVFNAGDINDRHGGWWLDAVFFIWPALLLIAMVIATVWLCWNNKSQNNQSRKGGAQHPEEPGSPE